MTPENTAPPNPVEQTRALAKQGAGRTIKDLLMSKEFHAQVAMALPRQMKPERFVRVALNATLRQPELLQCQRESLFLAFLQLSAMGIEADGRRAHLIPFWDTKVCVCGHKKEEHRGGRCSAPGCSCNTCQSRRLVQLIVDYKGIAELVRRSGDVSYIHADVVLDGDDWDFQFGSAAFLRHKPNLEMGPAKWRGKEGEGRKIIAVYSFVKLKDGSEDFIVLSPSDVEAVRARSKSANAGPWVSDYPEMAKKTAFRRHSKWLPLSPETRDAIEADDEGGEDFGAQANLVLDNLSTVPAESAPEDDEPKETLADRVAKAGATRKAESAPETDAQDTPGTGQSEPTGSDPVPEGTSVPPPEAEAPAGRKRGGKHKIPANLYDYADWERAQDSNNWGEEFIKVAGFVYRLVEGNYKKLEE